MSLEGGDGGGGYQRICTVSTPRAFCLGKITITPELTLTDLLENLLT